MALEYCPTIFAGRWRACVRSLFVILLCLLFASLMPGAARASSHDATPDEMWFAIELQGMPIGGDHEVNSVVKLDGQVCRLTTSTTHSSLKLMGASVQQDVQSRDWVGYKSGAPVYEEVLMTSSSVTTKITATFSGRTITADLNSGGQDDKRVLTVPPGSQLLADDPSMMAPPTTTKGKMPNYVYFDPATLALEPVSVKAVGEWHGKFPHVIKVSMATGDVTVTQDDQGVPIRIDLPIGLSVVRESAAQVAPLMSGEGDGAVGQLGGAADFAVVTSVIPTGKPLLDHPSKLSAIVKIEDQAPKTIEIVSQKAAYEEMMTQSQSTATLASDMRQYLSNASYLGLDNPSIRLRARNIVNGRTNPLVIAVQTERWVHDNMTASASVGLPRSAVEILSDRRGVCRDYALLYTALARSSGLPTKICAGLVGYQGRFYYHAWAQSFVGGKIGWLAVDPTLDEVPVDASHIALVQGDPAKMYDLVGKIGEISVTIASCTQ